MNSSVRIHTLSSWTWWFSGLPAPSLALIELDNLGRNLKIAYTLFIIIWPKMPAFLYSSVSSPISQVPKSPRRIYLLLMKVHYQIHWGRIMRENACHPVRYVTALPLMVVLPRLQPLPLARVIILDSIKSTSPMGVWSAGGESNPRALQVGSMGFKASMNTLNLYSGFGASMHGWLFLG